MNIVEWVKTFFNKDKAKLILGLTKQILRLLIGPLADKLFRVTQEEVAKAEASGKTGDEKWAMAFENIRSRFDEIGRFVINLAIEGVVAALNAHKA